jgi:RimJ/RimL family protein N-acetyltransferase
MLRGELTGLRARLPEDIDILHAELYGDVDEWVRADTRPWLPVPPGESSPYVVRDDQDSAAIFSVTELGTGDLAGDALLWAVDAHNRSAHLGISLRPAYRGRGLGLDAIRVLCRYGFAIRGLHRLQMETLSDNHAMISIAVRLGFTREGMTRGSSWVNGGFTDDVIFGLLVEEWQG